MKVLKPGRDQHGWSAEADCTGKGNGMGGCGARLLVEHADLFKTYAHHRDETDVFVSFRCAECSVLTDLEVPPQVAATVRDSEKVKPV